MSTDILGIVLPILILINGILNIVIAVIDDRKEKDPKEIARKEAEEVHKKLRREWDEL